MHHDEQKQVIHVNFDSAAVDPVYFPQLEVVGDIANSIWQIKEKVSPQSGWKLDFYKDVHEAYVQHRGEAEDDDRFPVLPERFVRDVRKVMPEDGIVTLDNGYTKSGLPEIMPLIARTPYCWTMRLRAWARVCLRPLVPNWCIRKCR